MNIYQRVTLVLGAIAAVVVFLTGDPEVPAVAFQIALLGRLALVLAVTGLVWFALRGARFDTIDWARFRERTRRVYLILWSGWLVFGLVWIPLQSEYERRDVLSKQDQIMNRYPELRGLELWLIRVFLMDSISGQKDFLESQLSPEIRRAYETLQIIPYEKRKVLSDDPPGFAGHYRKYGVGLLSGFVLIPAGLYVLPWVMFAAARWVGGDFSGGVTILRVKEFLRGLRS